jgi:hypothetical protein
MVLSISFSGGSWLGMCYYLGCMSYINAYIKDDNIITLGASAGSWASLGIQLRNHISLNTIKRKVYELFDEVGKYPFKCEKIINDFFDDTFRDIDDDMIKEIGENLYISSTHIEITRFIFENNLVSNISSKEELKTNLIRSSRVPGMVGFSKHNIDGAFTNNQPIHDENTIKINCITGFFNAHIYPSKFINPIYFYRPPPIEKREYIFLMGFNDTKKYFEKNGIPTNN